MRSSKAFSLPTSALLALAALLVAASPSSAQPCAPPTLSVATTCPSDVFIELIAGEDYDGGLLRVFEMPGMILVVELPFGPLGVSESYFFPILLGNGEYSIEGTGFCLNGGIASVQQPLTMTCSILTLTTQLGSPVPAQTSSASIALTQQLQRAESLLQTWSGPAFDVSGFALLAVEGTAAFAGQQGDDLTMDLVVTSLGADSAVLGCVVTDVSPSFLAFLLSLGGADPTGTTIGSVTISTGAPLGPPTIAVDIPDPFPPASSWVPADPWSLVIDLTTPFVVLPAGASTVSIGSDVTLTTGGVANFSEDIPIAPPPVLYVPGLLTELSTTAAGQTAILTQTIQDPTGERLTVDALSEFDGGSLLLAGHGAGASVGTWRIDFTSLPQALTGSIVVTSPGGSLMEADLIAQTIHPIALTLLNQLGLPNPLGTAVWSIEYENLAGGGVLVHLGDHTVFPLGQPVPVVQDLNLVLEHQIGLVLPAASGDLTVASMLTSQYGETVSFTEVFAITGGAGGDEFERGDANADGAYDIGDAIFTLSALFSGGPAPSCADAADANDDGANDIGDAIYTLTALFSGGAPPGAPRGACGIDPSADSLGCLAYPPCP